MTISTFPFCGLFLIIYLASYKKKSKSGKKKNLLLQVLYCTCCQDKNGNTEGPVYSLRPFLSHTNRYAGNPLGLWWNALIDNECKYFPLLLVLARLKIFSLT